MVYILIWEWSSSSMHFSVCTRWVCAASFRFQLFILRERSLRTNWIAFWMSSRVGTDKVAKSKFLPRVETWILIVHLLPSKIISWTKAGRIFPNVRNNFIRLVTEVKEKIQHPLKFLHESMEHRMYCKTVKFSNNRPVQAQRVLGSSWQRHGMVVGCQPYAPAAFTPRKIPGTHFHYWLSGPQGHGLVGRKYVTEKSIPGPSD